MIPPMRNVLVVFSVAAILCGVSYAVLQENAQKVSQVRERAMFVEQYTEAPFEKKGRIAEYFSAFISYPEMVDALQKADQVCHSEAHPLGRAVYRKTNSLDESLKICGNSCSDGCSHGVLMEMFSSDSDYFNGRGGDAPSSMLQALAEDGDALCRNGVVASGIFPRQCFHGMGHVMMYMAGYDLAKAVNGCDALNAAYSVHCRSGAFMEFMGNDRADSKREVDPYYPCDIFPQYARGCYFFRANAILKAHGLPESLELCRKLTKDDAHACIHGLGAALFYFDQSIVKENGGIEKACSMNDPAELDLCVEGALDRVAIVVDDRTDEGCNMVASDYRSRCAKLLQETRALK
jgi:hypothetical protein